MGEKSFSFTLRELSCDNDSPIYSPNVKYVKYARSFHDDVHFGLKLKKEIDYQRKLSAFAEENRTVYWLHTRS